MKKKYIIKSTREFASIINKRQIVGSKYFAIYLEASQEDGSRYGISVPKKLGNAVLRNKKKRQLKNILIKDQNNFEIQKDCIIIVKKASLNLSFEELEKELNRLLNKIK